MGRIGVKSMYDEQYQIPIPADVRTRMELINGIGIEELVNTGVAGIIGILLGYIYNLMFHNYLIAVGIFGVITVLTFIAVMKDKHNTSIAMLIGNIIKFYNSQQYFKYEKIVRRRENNYELIII
jgi:hypothetical protein